jgi:hypothetical protein
MQINENPLGPREHDLMPSYHVVVDFKTCSVPEDCKCVNDCPASSYLTLVFLLLLNDVKKDDVLPYHSITVYTVQRAGFLGE